MILYPSRHYRKGMRSWAIETSLSRLVNLGRWGPDRVLGVNTQTRTDWRLAAPPLISLATGRALTPLRSTETESLQETQVIARAFFNERNANRRVSLHNGLRPWQPAATPACPQTLGKTTHRSNKHDQATTQSTPSEYGNSQFPP